LSTIFVFVIQQYNLMVCVDFSLIGYNPTVSHLLAGIPICIADDVKGLWQWGGDGLKNNFVDFSVEKKVLLNLFNFIRKKFVWHHKILFYNF